LGKGNCTDFHSLFISMARSVGIPARFVIGAPIPQGPEGTIAGYHCWAEFYSPQAGWVPVDASEAWKHPRLREYYFGTLDPNKLLISVGRNIQLVPAQAGPPVNFFIYPYVEVDGTPRGVVETRFEYRTLQQEEKA
jgi:transglutaminase-like putative cysteine protease